MACFFYKYLENVEYNRQREIGRFNVYWQGEGWKMLNSIDPGLQYASKPAYLSL